MKENLIKLKDLKFEDFKNIINTGLKYHFDHDLENATDEEIKAVLGGHGFQGELKDTCNMLLDIIKNNKYEDYIGLGNAGFQMNKCGFLFDSALEETYLRYLSLFKYIKNGGKIKGIDSSAMHQVISARSFAGVDYLEGTKENTNQLYQALKLKYRTNEILKNIKISEPYSINYIASGNKHITV